MKFNRKKLEELTLEKIDEVNDEAGYRKYLEVPEMVNIIASIMEEKYMQIINDTLRELPVGSISRHTPESIPERVGHWVRESAEECRLREEWEACADNLIHYAKDFARYLEDNICVNNPFVSHQNYQAVSNAITQYEKLTPVEKYQHWQG